MKKFIVPAVLFVLAVVLFAFLKADPFQPKMDGARYLHLREEIDLADMTVLSADSDSKEAAIARRDSLWGVLIAMRDLESSSKSVEAPVTQTVSAPVKKESSTSNIFLYILGGLILLLLIACGVFLFLRNRQEEITRQLEKIRAENRFKTPKGGLDDPTFVDRTRVHRRSIIDDVKENPDVALNASLPIGENVEFENADGEVKIPALRPTAKERITKAVQSLSDTLSRLSNPKGVHRDPDKVNKIKAQSHNTLQTEAIPKPNPLEMTRFDRERADKEKVLQLNRRGLTPSEIARRTQLSEEQVETVIRIKRETGE